MFTGETAAPLEHPLEQISSTTALLVAVPFVYNIGYTDPSVFPPYKKNLTFFHPMCSLTVETTLKADAS